MQPIKDSFDVTYLQEALPPVQKVKNTVFLNFSLEIPETLYLGFIASGIQSSLDIKVTVIFMGASEVMQNKFNTWVEAVCKEKKFSVEELNLDKIITSIWIKTKTQISNELKLINNPELIEQEKKHQAFADDATDKFNKTGNPGKCFTTRQGEHLLKTFKSLK